MAYYSRRQTPAYQPGQKGTYKLSRSKIELYKQCPRCFWLGERLKIKRPDGPPFQINKAIDELFKKEFDTYREKGEPHPMMVAFGLKAVPFSHDNMDVWRQNFIGVQTLHKPTNLTIFGAVDDIWVNDEQELIVVDYKATAKQSDVTLDADWQISYKRQMEIYQWLLRQNDFKVNNTGYFVYANGRMDLDAFNDKVEFRTKIIPYTGSDTWIEQTLQDMKNCLDGEMPDVGTAAMGGDCDYCSYAKARAELTIKALQSRKKSKATK